MEITVDRNGALELKAPLDASTAILRAFVLKKRFWIYTKLAQRERLQQRAPARQFVVGEGFPYLGRNHRLRLSDEQEAPLKLVNGRFVLRNDALPHAREHFLRWYGERALVWLQGRVNDLKARMSVEPAGVKVRDLGYRWGSCGKGGWLYFHWKSILLPAHIVEYIVVHEMAHLHEPHHTPAFWGRVERVLPDYQRRKAWLLEQGNIVDTV